MRTTSEPTKGAWRVVGDEIVVAVDEAESWGASLAVLVSALHHPSLLAAALPETDAAVVAQDVVSGLGQLRAAAESAAAHTLCKDSSQWGRTSLRRDGDDIVFSPGAEVANFAWCLEVFAAAVLDPSSKEATIARGATAYAASAWSRDIGKATGTL